MKKLIILLTISITMVSCHKQRNCELTTTYNASGTTVVSNVTLGETYSKSEQKDICNGYATTNASGTTTTKFD